MVVDKQIGRKRKIEGTNINCRLIDLLKFEDFGILVYNFNLTKRGTLHFRTIEILKKLLLEETMLEMESVEPSCRSRILLKPETVGMHVDSDRELVDEREEYGSSSSTSSHSYEYVVDSNGVPEAMSDFE